MKKLIVALVGLAVIVAILLNYLQDNEAPESEAASRMAPAIQQDQPTASSSRARRRHLARKQSTRAEIERIIRQEVAPLQGKDQVVRVEAYLAKLEVRARAAGKVTALEVEPGLAAIRGLGDRIGSDRTREKLTGFADRMSVLSAKLDGRALSTRPVDLDGLALRIERMDDVTARQRLIRTYLEAAQALQPDQQRRHLARLNSIAAATRHRNN